MSNIISLFSASPFIGTWIDDRLFPDEHVITAEGGKLAISHKTILEEGESVENPDEELYCVITRVTKDTLEYTTWYDLIGRRAYRTVTPTTNRDTLLTKITYSDVTPAEKIPAEIAQTGIYGIWKPTNDDFWSEYHFSQESGQLNVRGFESDSSEEYFISNVQSGEGWVSFEAETLSDGRYGEIKFAFDETGTNAIMHFTFTEFGRLRRVT